MCDIDEQIMYTVDFMTVYMDDLGLRYT
jgi:hypothetical protein